MICNKIKYLISSLVVALLAIACSGLPMSENVVDSRYAGVSFNYNWSNNTQDITRADSIYCLLNRIQYTCHYFVKTDRSGLFEHLNEVTSAEEVGDGSLFDSKFYIKPGEYNICIFEKPLKGVKVDSLQNYINDTRLSLRELLLHVEDCDMMQLKALVDNEQYISKWIDMNSAYPYIENIAPIACDYKKNCMINSGTTTTLQFTPQELTQRVVIPFEIRLDEEVKFEKALVEVSGLTRKKYLLSEKLLCGNAGEETGRTIVEARQISSQGNTLSFEAAVTSLGIIPNHIDTTPIGPGVIQIAVSASVGDKMKIFRTTRNISSLLRAKNSVIYDKEGDYYKVGSYDITLDTDYRFFISREDVLLNNENGILEWDEKGNDLEGEI